VYAVRHVFREVTVFRGVAPAAILAAAVVAGAAGCGSSPGHAAASAASATSGGGKPAAAKTPDSLSGETADQIVTKAVADFKAASAVQVAGRVTNSGQVIGMDLTLAESQGCTGTMSLAGKGAFQLVELHGKFWLKPNDQFYKSYGAGSVLPLLSGKWLAPGKSSGLADFTKLCSLNTLAGALGSAAPDGLTKSAGPVIDGQPTVKITDIGDSAAVYISDSATPEMLRLVATGSDGGNLDFRDYGAAEKITAPPASETINGSQYGF
jgi:hypothetical protein